MKLPSPRFSFLSAFCAPPPFSFSNNLSKGLLSYLYPCYSHAYIFLLFLNFCAPVVFEYTSNAHRSLINA